jgi:hypothetical protein
MRVPDTIIIEGRAWSWRALMQARRAQVEALRRANTQQPALFDLREDHRPAPERSAASRYREPTLLGLMAERG